MLAIGVAVLLGLALSRPAQATVIEVAVTVKSVNLQSRQVTVVYETESGEKEKQLDVPHRVDITVAGEPGTLESLKPGQKAKVSYENELQVVTRIEANDDGEVATEPVATTTNAFNVKLGEQRILLPPEYQGLKFFPDEPIAFLRQKPFTFLMTAKGTTYLMAGRSLQTAVPGEKVLVPGARGSFDNGYAGAGSAYFDQKRREWLIFYHAEDQEGMPRCSYNNIKGAYWSIGLGTANADFTRWKKVGQILAPSVKKSEVTWQMQGIGEVCVIPDASRQYLYAYFTDLTRKKGAFAATAKIAMARCKIEDGGRPGQWMKYYNGDFTEPGLGGKEGAVVFPPRVDSGVTNPHVTYIPAFRTYMMVCNVMVHSDHLQPRAKEGGVYYCYSKNGIRWSEPKRLLVCHPIPYINCEYIAHPHLLLQHETQHAVSGLLLYCYSPRFGYTRAQVSDCLAGRPITFALTSPGLSVPEPSTSVWELLVSLVPRVKSSQSNNKGELIAGDLTGVTLSHEEVRAISTIKSLERATLAGTGVDDEDVKQLVVLPRLRVLDLSRTNITDVSVSSLSHLRTLEQLDVRGTKMSSDAVARLRQAVPKCDVRW
jgi:hypothetical protein